MAIFSTDLLLHPLVVTVNVETKGVSERQDLYPHLHPHLIQSCIWPDFSSQISP